MEMSCSPSFDDAIALRDHGDPAAAARALESIAKRRCDNWAAAAYELALLEHGRGRHAAGDALLSQLGFRHRLCNEAFHPSGHAQAIIAGNGSAAPLRVLDGALSGPLLAQVVSLFGPSSPFWGEHGYPTASFFSYNAPIKRRKRKRGSEEPSVAPGGSLLRAVAQSLLPAAEAAAACTPDPTPTPAANPAPTLAPNPNSVLPRSSPV